MNLRINELETSYLDLSLVPAPFHNKKITQVTLGDVHGNTMKVICELVYAGICAIEQAHYVTLFNIYIKRGGASRQEQEQFLRTIQQHLKVINTNILVRFIGDILSDRGSNDLYTLEVLSLLHRKKVPVCIILSNHDCRFIRWIEEYQENGQPLDLKRNRAQYHSLFSLQKSILDGVVTFSTIKKKYKRCYLNKLKLLDFSLNLDKTQITIYSHAPIDLPKIQDVAEFLTLTFSDQSVPDICQTIDDINQVIISSLRENSFHCIYDLSNPIGYCLWNRDENLKEASMSEGSAITYQHIHFVYGHTKKILPSLMMRSENVFRIDNVLGKYCADTKREQLEGLFAMHVSNDSISLAASSIKKCQVNFVQLYMKSCLIKCGIAENDVSKKLMILESLMQFVSTYTLMRVELIDENVKKFQDVINFLREIRAIDISEFSGDNDTDFDTQYSLFTDKMTKANKHFSSVKKKFPLVKKHLNKGDLKEASFYDRASLVMTVFTLSDLKREHSKLIAGLIFLTLLLSAAYFRLCSSIKTPVTSASSMNYSGMNFFSFIELEEQAYIPIALQDGYICPSNVLPGNPFI